MNKIFAKKYASPIQALCLAMAVLGVWGQVFGETPRDESNTASAPAENFILNPSFENPPDSYFWHQDNWAKNDVEFALDTNNPHSGTHCQRVSLVHITGQADLSLMTPSLPVKPGMFLQLRFWTRGIDNTRPILILLRKRAAPYSVYFQAEVNLSKDWSESNFSLPLPANTDPKDTALFFSLRQEGTFWLDDVSLTTLPEQQGGEPLVGNQIKNGSFEVGKDHWYATFREKAIPDDYNRADEANTAANIVAKPEADAPQGRNVLAFEVFPGCRINLTSAYFHLRYGHPATLRFWWKSSSPRLPFRVILGAGRFPSQIFDGQTFSPATEGWNFYHRTVTPKLSTAGTYFVEFAADQPGQYELDGVSMVEGEAADAVFPTDRVEVGWGLPEGTPAGNLFYPSDEIHFPLLVVAPSGQGNLPVHLRLVDYRENEIKHWDVAVPLDARGSGQTDIPLPSDRLGGFKVEAYAGAQGTGKVPDSDLLYSVVPRLKPPGQVADSFFGAHVALSPYNLAIAERLGVRWVRLQPPLCTKWVVVEREKGKFDLDTRGPARAHALGFHVLGFFDTAPGFYADGDPAHTRTSTWYNSFPPADWDAWRNYVQKTATAFGPYVDAWEVWNEPDGGFLRLPPGKQRELVYIDILKQTRQALDDAKIHAFLIGNVAGMLDRAFTWRELELGGGKEVDALSFHLYNEVAGPEEKKPSLADQVAKMRSYLNRSGETPQIWNTENGFWLNNGRSWLDSAEIPVCVGTTVADAANSVARTYAGLKAMGLQHCFFYAAYASTSGRIVYRDDCCGIIDVNGVPLPSGAAYAASVHFLENAQPVGLDVRATDAGHVTLANFKSAEGPLTVIWSRGGAKLGQVADLDWKNASGFDLMGNPVVLSADTPVTLDPIYLEGKAISTGSQP